ncbi:MAG: CotH kinase family protein [Verrucomicrobiales bacterium]
MKRTDIRVNQRATIALLAALLTCGEPQYAFSAEAAKTEASAAQSEFFDLATIHTAHLTFTAKQWEAMEPPAPQGGPFGGGRGGFGPGMFFAPKVMELGDANKDGKIDQSESKEMGGKWFDQLNKEKKGELDGDQFRSALNENMQMPGGGAAPAPGPGRRGPGMNLQGAEGKRNGVAAMMGIEFNYVHADLELNGKSYKDVAVRYKGNGTFLESRGSLKRSLKIDLNKYVKGQKAGEITTLNFHNNITDPSWMNEPLSYRFFRDAKAPAPKTSYVKVFVTVPGKHDREYFGLYSVVQDIDGKFQEENFQTKKGAIFKPVTPSLFQYLGNDWAKYKQTYDPKDDPKVDQAQRVIDFAKLVTEGTDAEFEAKVGDYLDLENFSRYMAALICLVDLDGILGPGQNFYLHLHPKTQKFQFIAWDMDHSFGQFPMRGTQEQRENLNIWKPWQGENRFLERIYKVEAFRKLYKERLEEFSKTLFIPERLAQQVEQVRATIKDAVKEENPEKLARLEKAVKGEEVSPVRSPGGGFGPPPGSGPRQGGLQPPGPGGPPGGGGPGRGNPFNFGAQKPINSFVPARAKSIKAQLAGESKGMDLGEFGMFGGRPQGGGPGGRPGGPGGPPGGFGPGTFLGPAILNQFDTDKNSKLSREEAIAGFKRWHDEWNKDKKDALSEEDVRAGLNESLNPFRGGQNPFGPPGGPRPGRDGEDKPSLQ